MDRRKNDRRLCQRVVCFDKIKCELIEGSSRIKCLVEDISSVGFKLVGISDHQIDLNKTYTLDLNFENKDHFLKIRIIWKDKCGESNTAVGATLDEFSQEWVNALIDKIHFC